MVDAFDHDGLAQAPLDQDGFAQATLDQWAMFVAVCERGSVHAAGRALGRSHSALSHALGVLQGALGQPLLVLRGRRLVPTEAGAIVAHRAKLLLESAHALEGLAGTLALGWEAELRVAVDGVVPRSWLARALVQFEPISRGARVRIEHQLRAGAELAARDPRLDLAVTTVLPDGASPDPLGIVHFAPVVGRDHPLARRRPRRGELERSLQIVLADTGPTPEHTQRGWLRAHRRWTVPDVGTAKALLVGGQAFAILPRDDVEDELARGLLVRVAPPSRDFAVQALVVLPKGESTGPAARALAETLRASAQTAA